MGKYANFFLLVLKLLSKLPRKILKAKMISFSLNPPPLSQPPLLIQAHTLQNTKQYKYYEEISIVFESSLIISGKKLHFKCYFYHLNYYYLTAEPGH